MNPQKSKINVQITLKAQEGKEEALSSFLSQAASLVAETEENTLYWYATRVDESTFTINDGFENESALNEHFNGKVAAALKENASTLITGGWENGVLPNIVKSEVLSIIE